MSFWKVFFGSMLGFIAGMVILFFLSFILIAGFVAALSSNEPVTVEENSVLTLDLDYDISEQTDYQPFENFSFGNFDPTINPGVYDIVKNIRKAKEDDDIKGIYMNFGFTGAGTATAEQIRNALDDFKKSGKFVVAYAELYTERSYYLCSVADKVFVNPKGEIEYNGINAEYTFYKHLLEKIGVEPQIFYNGKFKSATEPFRLDSMSRENKLMTNALIEDVQSHIINKEAESRKVPVAELDSINDNFLVRSPSDAVRYHVADSAYFVDQVHSYMKRQLNLKEKDKINFISLTRYMNVEAKNKNGSVDDVRIAILFAEGDIVSGSGDDDNIGSKKYVDLLRKLREDEKIKAIVLRVNSPGGSALASDVIAREVELTVMKKPVVVSMGDYAASGGYYISALASKIVAQPNTLTGSIGVFGILPNMQKLFEDKLGITFDNVTTGKYSDFGDPSRPLREDEKKIIQNEIDTIYSQFKATVVKGRKLDGAMVDSIAQGRVWTGNQALSLGLVDTLGGIEEAIKIAARLANASEYRTVEYPEIDKEWFPLIEAFSDKKNTEIKKQLGVYYPLYEDLKELSKMNDVQARMPSVLRLE